jgi:uncharacterized membrane protein YqjE
MLRDSIAKFFKVDNLISNLTGYVETRIELLKVEAKEELAKVLSTILVFMLLAFVLALVIVFISISVGIGLAERIGGLGAFASVAGFYLLIGLILFLLRQSLGKKLEKKISSLLKAKNG